MLNVEKKKKQKALPPIKLIIAGLKTDLLGVSGGLVKSVELTVRRFRSSCGILVCNCISAVRPGRDICAPTRVGLVRLPQNKAEIETPLANIGVYRNSPNQMLHRVWR